MQSSPSAAHVNFSRPYVDLPLVRLGRETPYTDSMVLGIDIHERQIAPVVLVRYYKVMQWLVSFLIMITLTCPVMCPDDIGCYGQSDGGLARSQSPACCSHCQQQQHPEDGPQEGIPPQPGRPCACSCLCSGAVLVESVSLPNLPVVWFCMDLSAPIPPENVSTGIVQGDSSRSDRCPIAGYALRIEECSLRC